MTLLMEKREYTQNESSEAVNLRIHAKSKKVKSNLRVWGCFNRTDLQIIF